MNPQIRITYTLAVASTMAAVVLAMTGVDAQAATKQGADGTASSAPRAAAAPASASSAAGRTDTKLRPTPSAAQAAESAQMPGEVRPENPVQPQISIPLGRAASGAVPVSPLRGRLAAGTTAGSIDDSAARCQAQTTAAARESCRTRLNPQTAPR